MPNEHRPLKVFLSYASQDRPVVRELSRRLVGEGWIDPWLDEKKLLPGQDWRLKIEEAVETSDIVIICLSSNSVSKEGFVQKELRYAREIALEKPDETIFLIPLRLDDCETPRGLRFYQWVDYFGEKKDESYNALIESLKLRHEQKLKLEEVERARKEKETLEREEIEKAEREKTKREAAEKLQLEKEEQGRQSVAREKEEQDTIAKAIIEKQEKELQRELENNIKKAKRELRWKKFKIDIRYRLQLISIYRVPSLILIVALAIIIPLSIELFDRIPKLTQALNATPTAINALVVQPIVPSKTIEPSQAPTESLARISTPTENSMLTTTPLPSEITDGKGVEMVFVPAGEFKMGSDTGKFDEKPIHSIYLNAYFIDRYEISIGRYKECVAAKVCQLPGVYSRYYFYRDRDGREDFDDFPVVNITWYDAVTYCDWRGARLPTEAEWEKSARGADERIYPWGEDEPQPRYFDTNSGEYLWGNSHAVMGTSDYDDVFSMAEGQSPYGAYNLAGNVWEWVMDKYDSDYYTYSDYKNPQGPQSGLMRVLRGGSYKDQANVVRTTYRHKLEPTQFHTNIGFRCAKTTNP